MQCLTNFINKKIEKFLCPSPLILKLFCPTTIKFNDKWVHTFIHWIRVWNLRPLQLQVSSLVSCIDVCNYMTIPAASSESNNNKLIDFVDSCACEINIAWYLYTSKTSWKLCKMNCHILFIHPKIEMSLSRMIQGKIVSLII